MPYEVGLLRRLGYEVYVPKIIPKSNFRSGAVDWQYDAGLSVPARVLQLLNGFNFYEDEWTPAITATVNRYFGAAFVIPHGRSTAEAVDNFEGQIVFRVFGLQNDHTYGGVLEALHGPELLRKINGIAGRFWFGQAYPNLLDVEDDALAGRPLFLPVGLPESYYAAEGEWVGGRKAILFVCPNAVSNPYYAQLYREFKLNLGHLPHVIVGQQDVPVPDPSVLGFVSDDELQQLYRECAVMFYPSREQRHIHYSPVEAAIVGMPVVFFEESLLDVLGHRSIPGRVADYAEARALIAHTLEDNAGARAMAAGQRVLAHSFSDEYCTATWKRSLDEGGFTAAMRAPSAGELAWAEVKRVVLRPVAGGRTRVDPHRQALRPPRVEMTAERANQELGWSLFDGINFAVPQLPCGVEWVSGIGPAEHWGRWSTAPTVVFALKHRLEGRFRLRVDAVGYRTNADRPISVKVGSVTKQMWLKPESHALSSAFLHFNLRRPSSVIEVRVPAPVRPETDDRLIGVGFVSLQALEPVTMTADDSHGHYGASLNDGLAFDRDDWPPPFVESASGLGRRESWGRWSDGPRVFIELRHQLAGEFYLLIDGFCYGPSIASGVVVAIGGQRRRVFLSDHSLPGHWTAIRFKLSNPSNVIEFAIPRPAVPPGDNRPVGIGFTELKTVRSLDGMDVR
jgi:hypothetical protein